MTNGSQASLISCYETTGLGGTALWCSNYDNLDTYNQTDIDWLEEDAYLRIAGIIQIF